MSCTITVPALRGSLPQRIHIFRYERSNRFKFGVHVEGPVTIDISCSFRMMTKWMMTTQDDDHTGSEGDQGYNLKWEQQETKGRNTYQ